MYRYFLIVLMITAGLIAADEKKSPSWDIGISGGLNFATMFGPGIENIKDKYEVTMRMTGNGNLSLCYWTPGGILGIETGVGISGKGFHFTENKTINGMDVQFTIQNQRGFLEIPLLLKPRLKTESHFVYLLGGFSFGRMIKAVQKVTADVTYWGGDTSFTVSTNDYLKQGVPFYVDTMGTAEYIPFKELNRLYDISLVLGGGAEARFMGGSWPYGLFIDIHYYLGLIDNSNVTTNGARSLNEKYSKLFRFFENNNIDPADMGYGPDDVEPREPIHKFSTLSIMAGWRFYF